MSIIVSKTVKIGPKGVLNDVIGRKTVEVRKKFFSKYSKFHKEQNYSMVWGLKMKLKWPKIRKTAKNRYSAQFYIRKYRENAHFHENGFKSMFLPIKILEPRFFWSLRHTSNQKTSKEKCPPQDFFG